MKLKAYNVPIKNGCIFYMPEDPIVFTKDITRAYQPEDPFVITRAMARAYLHERRKNERFQVELLTPEIDQKTDDLKRKIESGLFDTAYKDEKYVKEILSRLNQWYVGALINYWFYRFFLGPMLVLTSLGRIAEIGAGVELMIGRSWFVRNIEKLCENYFHRIARGTESSYKDVEVAIQKEDFRLKKLKQIIDSCEDKIEAYKKAYHACDELGLPQLKDFYLQCMPMGEWKIQEPHIYFPLGEVGEVVKPQIERVEKRKNERKQMKLPNVDLFDYSISAKELQGIKRYSDLEKLFRNAAEEGGFEEAPMYTTEAGKTLWAFEIGNHDAEEAILIKAGCHGEEDASPRAILQIMRSLGKNGNYTEEILKKSRIVVMPCDDPEGFDMRGKIFVDMAGHEEHWPVQRGMVRYRDANGVWGDHARSPRIMAMQEYIEKNVKPTFAIDMHETVFGDAEFWFRGAGILSIEDFHIPVELRKRAEKVKVIPENKISRIISKIPLRKQLFAMEYARDIMRENPAFELGEAMMQHVRDKGFKTFKVEYQKLTIPPFPLYPPQLVFFDEGRCIDGPLLYDRDIRVCTSWLHDKFGTLAFTSETFSNPLDERVCEDLAYVEGGIMKRLGIGRYARQG